MSEAIRQAVQAVPFNAHVGLEVLDAEAGRARVQLPDAASVRNHVGGPHAAAIFAAAEAASGAAVMSTFGDLLGQVIPLLAGATIEYKKLAMGTLVAKASLGTTREAVLAALESSPKGAEVPVTIAMEDASGRVVAEVGARWFLRKQA